MRQSKTTLAISTLVAALAGLLFGYDNIVISGAIGYLSQHFHLSAVATGWAAACAIVGCLLGAIVSGAAAERFGLKRALYGCAICFALSSWGVWSANSFTEYFVWRIVGGVGIGWASIVAPRYLAEISPSNIRGRLVVLYQLGIVIGILAAVSVNTLIQRSNTAEWNIETGWRVMFAAAGIPAALFGLTIFFSKESPRWLMRKGQILEAHRVLRATHGVRDGEQEAAMIARSLGAKTGTWKDLVSTSVMPQLRMGIILAAFSQASGITAVLSYLPEIFKQAGQKADDAFTQSILVGAVNLIATLVAMTLVDRAGRKTLLFAGTILQTLALASAAALYAKHQNEDAILICIMTFVAGHAIGNGAVCWVIISEIFPNKIRGVAMSVAITGLWFSAFLANQFYPVLQERLSTSGVFFMLACFAAANLVYAAVGVPETKGRSLEQIEQLWVKERSGSATE